MLKKIVSFGKVGIVLGLTLCLVGTSLSVAFSVEKTPIEIYNPEFGFPTENITVTFWDFFDDFPRLQETTRELIEKYEQIHPNITVEWVNIPWEAHRTKYITAFTSGQGPDLCYWQLRNSPPGVATPAPDWAVKMMEDNFSEAALNGSRYNGIYYGPMANGVDPGQMLYYNKTMFREAGLADPPKTLPELVEYGKKVTVYGPDDNIVREGWAIRYFGDMPSVYDKFQRFAWAFLDSTKIGKYNEDFTDVVLDHPGYLEALRFYKNLVWESRIASVQFPYPYQALMLRLAAMTNRESFLFGLIRDQHPDLLDSIGIVPLVNGAPPYGEYEVGTVGAAPRVARQVWVTRDSGNPQVAWDLNMFLRGVPEHDLMLAEAEGAFPRCKENLKSEYVKNLPTNDAATVMFERPAPTPSGLLTPFVEAPITIGLGEAVAKIIVEKDSDIEAIWRKAIEASRKVIAKYWKDEEGREIEFRELSF